MDRRVIDGDQARCPSATASARPARLGRASGRRACPTSGPERMFGRTTNNLPCKNIRWARKGIFSFSFVPLEIIFYLALGVSALTGLMLVVYAVVYLFAGAPDGLHDASHDRAPDGEPAVPLPRRDRRLRRPGPRRGEAPAAFSGGVGPERPAPARGTVMVERNVAQFDEDVRANAGYLYTTNARKSSVLANHRLTDVTRAMVDLRGKRVIDVGCGDGTYVAELFASCAPAAMVGVDASREAIESANRAFARPGLRFDACSVYDLPYEARSFDVAVVRGLLHHLDDAPRALARDRHAGAAGPPDRAQRLQPDAQADRALLALPPRARREVVRAARCCGAGSASSAARSSASSTPASSRSSVPDWMATGLKAIEPAIEAMPVARQLSCAVFTVRYRTAA